MLSSISILWISPSSAPLKSSLSPRGSRSSKASTARWSESPPTLISPTWPGSSSLASREVWAGWSTRWSRTLTRQSPGTTEFLLKRRVSLSVVSSSWILMVFWGKVLSCQQLSSWSWLMSRQMSVNDLPVGRSVDETLRLVQAFQFVEKHGEVCPAGWTPDSPTIKPNPKESLEYFDKVNW